MSTYSFTKKSYIFNQAGENLPARYEFDVSEDGAQLVECIVGNLDFLYIVPEDERESLEVECLERMSKDQKDAAIDRAEAQETSRGYYKESSYD